MSSVQNLTHIFALVGQPINVAKKTEIHDTDVNDLHQLYIQQLTELHNEHKTKYSDYPDAELEII